MVISIMTNLFLNNIEIRGYVIGNTLTEKSKNGCLHKFDIATEEYIFSGQAKTATIVEKHHIEWWCGDVDHDIRDGCWLQVNGSKKTRFSRCANSNNAISEHVCILAKEVTFINSADLLTHNNFAISNQDSSSSSYDMLRFAPAEKIWK
jgi:hypothetical protein